MSKKQLLKLKDVTKTYTVRSGILGLTSTPVQAVDGVTLQLTQGETLGLVGESGCGKSTLARLVTALEKPTSGTLEFKDKIISKGLKGKHKKEFYRNVQMVFQDPFSSLNPRQKVGDIITEPLHIHNIGSKHDRIQKAKELLDIVGLPASATQLYPHEFSGGQRQRIAIARALALEPELIICDEAVSALDVSIQAQILNLLEKLQKERNLTYLFISHDLSVVGHLSDRVAVMYLGKIIEIAPADIIFTYPLHPYTQALLAAIPQPDPEASQDYTPLTGDLPSPLNPPTGCPFHPRCPKALDVCSKEFPVSMDSAHGHSVFCHLYTNQME
ncbi:MAG: ABC transporter ATP-binding protein [Desulfovibrio sp.]